MMAQIRLYLLGGAALAILGLLSWLLWQLWAQSLALSASEAGRLQAQSQLDQVVAINRTNAATLATMAQFKQLDNEQLTKLAAELAEIQDSLAQSQTDRANLAEKDPDVKTFLSTPIPAALRSRVQPSSKN